MRQAAEDEMQAQGMAAACEDQGGRARDTLLPVMHLLGRVSRTMRSMLVAA